MDPQDTSHHDDPAARLEDSVIGVLSYLDQMRAEHERLVRAMAELVYEQVIGLMADHHWPHVFKLIADAKKTPMADAFPPEVENVLVIDGLDMSDTVFAFAPQSPSVLAYNGRSLDSHNPWHLQMSYEAHLDIELRQTERRREREVSVEEQWFEICADSSPVSPGKSNAAVHANLHGRNKVAGTEEAMTPPMHFSFGKKVGTTSSPPPFYEPMAKKAASQNTTKYHSGADGNAEPLWTTNGYEVIAYIGGRVNSFHSPEDRVVTGRHRRLSASPLLT